MQPKRAKFIVRIAALLTGVIAACCLGFVVVFMGGALPHNIRNENLIRGLAGYLVLAVLPCLFLHAAWQAWRFNPKGIVSIYSGYLLLGFLGFAANVLHFSWSRHGWDVFGAMVSFSAMAFGVLIFNQKGFFKSGTPGRPGN